MTAKPTAKPESQDDDKHKKGKQSQAKKASFWEQIPEEQLPLMIPVIPWWRAEEAKEKFKPTEQYLIRESLFGSMIKHSGHEICTECEQVQAEFYWDGCYWCDDCQISLTERMVLGILNDMLKG